MYSGEASRKIADALRTALAAMIQGNQYFFAHEDIPPGKDWRDHIQAELESSLFGIACVTPENVENPWIHFEAGAMSMNGRGVVPYLAAIDRESLHSTMQSRQILVADRDGTKRLAIELNLHSNSRLPPEVLDASFEGQWPKLESNIIQALEDLKKKGKRDQVIKSKTQTLLTESELGIDFSYSAYDKLGDELASIQDNLEADLISAWLPEPSTNPKRLRMIYSNDPNWKELRGLKLDLDPLKDEPRGIAAEVFINNEVNLNNDPAEDSHSKTNFFKYSSTKIKRMITMPLRIGGQPVGVCQIIRISAKPFVQEDASAAMMFSSQIGQLMQVLSNNSKGLIRDLADAIDRVYVTAIFSDINRYTTFAYTTDPENAMQFLNDYYYRMYSAVTSSGGDLREYTGDGVYAAFTGFTALGTIAPAIEAACKMRDAFQELKAKWKNFNYKIDEKENTQRMGICSGEATRAVLGHPNKRQVQLVGEPINTAYQLCHKTGLNQGEVILTNAATQKLIEIVGNCTFQEFDLNRGIFKVELPSS